MTWLNNTAVLALLALYHSQNELTAQTLQQITLRCNSSVTRAIHQLAENGFVIEGRHKTHAGQDELTAIITAKGVEEVRRYGKKAQFVNGVH